MQTFNDPLSVVAIAATLGPGDVAEINTSATRVLVAGACIQQFLGAIRRGAMRGRLDVPLTVGRDTEWNANVCCDWCGRYLTSHADATP